MAATYTLTSAAAANARTGNSDANSTQYFPALNNTKLAVTLDAVGQALSQSQAEVQKATVIVITTTSGALTLTAAPTIPNGYDGQEITVLNASANAVTVQDQGTLASSNLRLTAATVVIGVRNSIRLVYSSDVGDWVQTVVLTAVI